MSIKYQNDQNNPLIIQYDHEYKSNQPKLDQINKGGKWYLNENIDNIEITSKGIIIIKKSDVLFDVNNNIKLRELIVNYEINDKIYNTTFYIKIIPRTLLVTISDNGIITKEYDGTSIIDNNKINYIFISNGISYIFDYKNILEIEAKFYKDNNEKTFGGNEEDLLDISLNIVNKSKNYIIDFYSFGTNNLNCCKNIGYITKSILLLENKNKISKIYDGTNNVLINFKVDNLIKNQKIELDYRNIYFENKNVGNNIKIIIDEIKFKNLEDNEKYKIIHNIDELYGTIKPKPLSINFEIEEREYNSSQYTNIINYQIIGIVNNDNIYLSKNYIALFDNPDSGINKIVTINNIKLKGKDCKNYSIESFFKTTGNILKKKYNLNFDNIEKEYDGNFIGKIDQNLYNYESIIFSKNTVGTHIVTINDVQLKNYENNYEIDNIIQIFGTIKKRKLQVEYILPIKIYDDTTDIDIEYKILNLVPDDKIFLDWEICKLKNKNTGNNIVEIRNIKLNGISKLNYYYEENINIPIIVLQKEIFVKISFPSLIYGDNDLCIKDIKLEGLINSDFNNVYLIKDKIKFNEINNNEVIINNIYISGRKSDNYYVKDEITEKIKIKPRKINAEFILNDKIYDGTNKGKVIKYLLEGIINDDDIYLKLDELIVEYSTYYPTKRTKVTINNIKLYGEKNFCYEIENTKIVYGSIKNRDIKIDFVVNNKIYDANNIASVDKYLITNLVNNDNIYIEKYDARFINSNVTKEQSKVIIKDIILSGENAIYYDCKETFEAYAYIQPYKLVLEPIIEQKIFDNTNKVNIEKIKITNAYLNDEVFINDDFEAEYSNIETNEILISNINLTGKKSSNYIVDDIMICYSFILPKKISIIVDKIEKVYDGKKKIDVNIKFDVPDIDFSYKSINFLDSNVGINKEVIIKKLVINNKYYEIDTKQKIYGEIKKKEVVPIFEVKPKIYDSTNIANVKIVDFEGVINNDKIICESFNSYYIDCNASNEKKDIIVENIKINNNTNYYIKSKEIIKGYIQPKELIPIFKIKTKEYDGTINGEIKKYNLSGIINGDDVKIDNSIVIEFENENSSDNFKTVKISNIKLDGNQSNNYYIKPEILTKGLITKKKLIPKIFAHTKIYDGTNKANIIVELKDIQNNKIDCEYYNFYFETINAGENKVIIENINIINNKNYYLDNDNYCISRINKKKIIPIFKKATKIYDKNNDVNIEVDRIEGLISNDDVKINNNFKSSFISKDIVEISNISLEGKDSLNYYVDDKVNIEGIIQKRELKCVFIIKNKEFDDNTEAYIESYTLKNKILNDDVNIDLNLIKANFSNKNASNEKILVKIENIKLIGINSKYYLINDTDITYGYIYPKNLDYEVNVKDKIYDGTNIPTVDFILKEEQKTKFIFRYEEAYFKNIDVGNKIKVFIKNIYLEGITNFKVRSNIETYGNILPKELNLEYKNTTKIYDGTTKTNIILESLIENVKINDFFIAEYETKNYNFLSNKIKISNVTLNGLLSNNYIVNDKIIEGYIYQKKIKINFLINNKEYDGTNTATINSYTLEGIESSDDVDICKDYTINFQEINASDKPIEVTIKNIYLEGKNADNYFTDYQVKLFAKIFPKKIITKIICKNKFYNKNTNANIIIYLENIINNEKIICTYEKAVFEDMNVGNNKNIIISNVNINNNNYFIDKICYSYGCIIKKNITPNFNIFTKEYDGSCIVNYEVSVEDDLVLNNFNIYYKDKNVSENIPMIIDNLKFLNEENNYNLITDLNLFGKIVKKKLFLEIYFIEKEYDSTNLAIISNYKLIGICENDIVDLNLNKLNCFYKTIDFSKKKIEINVENIILIGNDSENYYIEKNFKTLGYIKQKKLEINFYAEDKIYDGNDKVITRYKIDNVFDDNIDVLYDSKFESTSSGKNKKVIISNINISNNNYWFEDTVIIYANINKLKISPQFQINSVNYSEVKTELSNIKIIPKLDLINNDDTCIKKNFKFKILNYNFENKNINVLITKLSLDGKDKNNYELSYNEINITSKIDPKELDIIFEFENKEYDESDNAIVKSFKIIGILDNDDVSINNNYVCKYEHINASEKKINIIVTKLSLIGKDAKNYTIKPIKKYKGYIKKKVLKPHIIVQDKIYNGKTCADIQITFEKNIPFEYKNAYFIDENVGINKEVLIENIKINDNNYILYTKYKCFGNIIKKKINIDFKIENKIYDKTLNVKNIQVICTINKFIDSYNAKYENHNVGDNIKIIIDNIKINSQFVNNYDYLISKEYFAKIMPLKLEPIFFIEEKDFDSLLNVKIEKYQLNNVLLNDDVILNNDFIAKYNDYLPGENKEITIKNINIIGKDINNYFIDNQITIYGNIKKKIVKPIIIVHDKVYNGFLDVNYDFVNSHEFIFKKILFENKDIGKQKVLINDLFIKKSFCYDIVLDNIYGNVSKRYLEPIFIFTPKIFDGTKNVLIEKNILKGKIRNDDVYIKSYESFYENENIGEDKEIIIKNIEIDGLDSKNYYVNNEYRIRSSIKPCELDIEFIIEDKIYDGNNIGKIKSYQIKNLFDNDIIILDCIVTYTDINVSKNKIKVIISEIKINNENNNYILKEEYYSFGVILPQKLNFIVNYEKKIYDGTTQINIKLISELVIEYKYADFEDKNIGNNKKINIFGLKINNKNFYIDDSYVSYGDILPLKLKIVFNNPKKIYDKKTNIDINILETNMIINDDIKILNDFKAEFCDSNVSLNKEIIIKNIKLSGKDTNNYLIDEIYYSNGEIIKKDLNISFDFKEKIFDFNNEAYIDSYLIYENYDNLVIENLNELKCLYEDINVGDNIKIIITNIILSGINLSNYQIKDKYFSLGSIKKKPINKIININDKIYDSTTKVFNFNNIDNIIFFNTNNLKYSQSDVGNNIKLIVNDYFIKNKNYFFGDKLLLLGNIIPKKIDVEFEFEEKEYDGTNTVILKSYKLIGLLENNIILNNNFISKYLDINSSENNLIEIRNISLSGEKINNYFIEKSKTCKSKINKKKIDIEFVFEEKLYDGTNNCKLISYSLNGLVDSDDIIINNDIIQYNFEIDSEYIIVKNIELLGINKNNYSIDNTKKVKGKIIKKKIYAIFDYTPKIYDGTTDIKVTGILHGIIDNDKDKVNISWESSKYQNPNCGNNSIIVSEIKLVGPRIYNYEIDETSIFDAYIKKSKLELVIDKNYKIYDGNNKFTFSGYIKEYNFEFTYVNSYFENEYCGTNKKIFVEGIKLLKNNKNHFIESKYEFIGYIAPKKLDIEFLCEPKIYDKNNIPKITSNTNFNIFFNAKYENINVGKQKIIISDIVLIDKNHYIDYKEKIIEGKILPKKIIIKCHNKIYDGLDIATLIIDESMDEIKYKARFETKNVGNNIKINIELLNKNYYFDEIITANIIPKNIYGICENKEYDGNTKASVILKDIISTDDVYYEGYFSDYNVNENIIVNGILKGNDSYNYLLTEIKTANIYKKNISLTCQDKEYDGTTNINIILNEIINDDEVYIDGEAKSSNVGIVEVNGKIFGKKSHNYNLKHIGSVKIFPKKIYGKGIDKIYDSTSNAKVLFDDILESDREFITIEGMFNDKNVETNKKIICKLIGRKSSNYEVVSIKNANITPKYINAIGQNKIYDNNSEIKIILEGVYESDLNNLKSIKGKLINNNIGISEVEITDEINLKNYILNNKFTTVNILPKKINITWEASPKYYDGTNNCTVLPIKISENDIFVDEYDATFENCNIGLNKKIIIKNIKLGGLKHENFITDNYILYSSIFNDINDIFINIGLEINLNGTNEIFYSCDFIYDYALICSNNKIEIQKKNTTTNFKLDNFVNKNFTIDFGKSNININNFTKTENNMNNLILEIISHKLFGNPKSKNALANKNEFDSVEILIWDHLLKSLIDKNEIKNIINQYKLFGRNNVNIDFTNLSLCVPIILSGQLSKNLSILPFYQKGYETGGTKIEGGKYKIPILVKFLF